MGATSLLPAVSAAGQVVALFTVPKGFTVTDLNFDVTKLDGGATPALTFSIGDAANPGLFLLASTPRKARKRRPTRWWRVASDLNDERHRHPVHGRHRRRDASRRERSRSSSRASSTPSRNRSANARARGPHRSRASARTFLTRGLSWQRSSTRITTRRRLM